MVFTKQYTQSKIIYLQYLIKLPYNLNVILCYRIIYSFNAHLRLPNSNPPFLPNYLVAYPFFNTIFSQFH